MTAETFFRGLIRAVFLCAYGAFLFASIKHIAFFFHSFEPQNSDWTGSYWLAISIDVTALMLTIGVMFFSKGMGVASAIFIWFFIICLTGFSWLVNYEYAAHFQNTELSINPVLTMMNPVLASAFAFLNLAYSITSGVFDSKQLSAEELNAQAKELEDVKQARERIKAARKGTGLIAALTETAQEVKAAASEILRESEQQISTPISTPETPVLAQQSVQPTPEQTVPISTPKRTPRTLKLVQSPEQKIRALLHEDSALSVRVLAQRAGCATSTANKWKKQIASEQIKVASNGHKRGGN